MTRLPRVTAAEALRKILRAGFRIARRSGSHMRLRNDIGRAVTIPMHTGEVLKLKTLATILEQAGLSVDEFIAL